VGALPSFPVQTVAAITPPTPPVPQQVAICGTVDPPPTGMYLVRLRNWWSGLDSQETFAVGIGAGVSVSLLALAATGWLIRWQAGVSSPAPLTTAPGKPPKAG
jgi:hypothetical protein